MKKIIFSILIGLLSVVGTFHSVRATASESKCVCSNNSEQKCEGADCKKEECACKSSSSSEDKKEEQQEEQKEEAHSCH